MLVTIKNTIISIIIASLGITTPINHEQKATEIMQYLKEYFGEYFSHGCRRSITYDSRYDLTLGYFEDKKDNYKNFDKGLYMNFFTETQDGGFLTFLDDPYNGYGNVDGIWAYSDKTKKQKRIESPTEKQKETAQELYEEGIDSFHDFINSKKHKPKSIDDLFKEFID